MQNLVLHEFSHAFCNPLIDKYYNSFEKDTCLLNPIRKAIKQQGSNTCRDALFEFLTRANQIVLIQQLFGKEDADKVYNDYLNQKWIYIKGLVPVIQKFQDNRNKYKTFEEIISEIIVYFDSEVYNCH